MIGPLLHLYQCRISPTQINLIFLSWIYFLLYCPALAISNQFFSPLTLPAASEHVFFLTHNESLQSNKRVENLLFTSFTSFTSLTMIRSYKWNIWDIFFLHGKYFFPKNISFLKENEQTHHIFFFESIYVPCESKCQWDTAD